MIIDNLNEMVYIAFKSLNLGPTNIIVGINYSNLSVVSNVATSNYVNFNYNNVFELKFD